MLMSIYRGLTTLATPLLLRKLHRRGRSEPLYLHAIPQRFGRYTVEEQQLARAHAGQWVWIHAVSLGETRAAGLLLAAIRAAQPDVHVLLTHGTATGRQEGMRLLQPGDMQVWLPWDAPGPVRRFLELFRPRVGLLMETEMWPELLAQSRRHGVPMALVNARVNDRTFRRSLRLRGLAFAGYGGLAVAYAQTAQDARRLRALHAPEVRVTGNLKFDVRPDEALSAAGHAWREQLEMQGPVCMLASSREGEEKLFLDALAALPSDALHGVHWMLVPRHPQRFDAVAAEARAAGWEVRRRSQWGQVVHSVPSEAPRPVLWLGDSMGEMQMYYAMADLVLMGGSFEPLGGQNLIEACACGCAVLVGPHTFNFAEASEQTVTAGAARRCADMSVAVHGAMELLQPGGSAPLSPELLAMREAARVFGAEHGGAGQAVVADMLHRGWLVSGGDAPRGASGNVQPKLV